MNDGNRGGAVFETDLGWAGISWTLLGIRELILPQPAPMAAQQRLSVKITDSQVKQPEDFIRRVKLYFSGENAAFPDELDLSGATAFQQRIWLAAREIAYGQTRSYGWLAKRAGMPGGARAVGQALGKNPLPVIIPCHRVIGSDGALRGFRDGLARKKFLLDLERNR